MYVLDYHSVEAQNQRRAAWSFRAKEELIDRPNAYFCTFTYKEELLHKAEYDRENLDNYKKRGVANFATVDKNDASLLIKYIQDYLAEHYGKKTTKIYKKVVNGKEYINKVKVYTYKPLVRYYFTAEYGDAFNRPHYHALLYFPHEFDKKPLQEVKRILQNIWQYGRVDVQKVNRAAIAYVGKHCIKDCQGNLYQRKNAPIFAKMSRYRGGIGIGFYLRNKDKYKSYSECRNVLNGSYSFSMPAWYKRKFNNNENLTDDEFLKIRDKMNVSHFNSYKNFLSTNGYFQLVKDIEKIQVVKGFNDFSVAFAYYADVNCKSELREKFLPQTFRYYDSDKQKFCYKLVDNVYKQFKQSCFSDEMKKRKEHSKKVFTKCIRKIKSVLKHSETYQLI